MKFTLSWLKDHLKTEAALAEVVDAMTMAGLEVEDVEDPGEKLKAFSVGRIASVAQHPNADKLQVCQVETRDGVKEIVCGGLNARAGLLTIYAPTGTYIPGTGITLEPKPVRGVVSHGMLCSEKELEIEDDFFGLREGNIEVWLPRALAMGKKDKAEAIADGGIMELKADAKVGTPLAELIGASDSVIHFEVTPNRPDWLGVDGIARDLAAAGLGTFIAKPVQPVAGKFPMPIRILTDDAEACPVFAARIIRGVRNGPSPAWLQQRLNAIGIKPRSALVDITNYLSFDRARPLHVYDASKLKGDVRARLGRPGESFLALDKKTYEVTPEMCVIADDAGVLGLGGVMGGEHSGSTADTVDVLIESALFDPRRTLQTGRATNIVSDARYRFERGVDPGFVLGGLELATRMALEFCGGEPSEIVIAGKIPAGPAGFMFDPDRVRTLAGIDVRAGRARDILKTLGFEVAQEKGAARFTVTPPAWRKDVEGPADLVEEISRIEGFDKLPEAEPPRAAGFRAPPPSVGETRTRAARRALAGAGYLECVTWSFCARAHAELFGGGSDKLVLSNPIAADLDCMRPSALPNLLRAGQRNLDRGRGDAMLFEAGAAWKGDQDADQLRTVAAIRQPRARRHWAGAPAVDVFTMKRDCLLALEAMGAPVGSLQAGSANAPWLHPGRSGELKLGAKPVAVFGELHPKVLAGLDVEGPAFAFEIDLDALPTPKAKAGRTKPPLEKLDLMPLSRDFAFIVEEKVAAGDLVKAAFGADKQLVADIALFDVYRGPGVPEGKKSLAIEVVLQPKEKTLGEAEIEATSAKIVSAVMKATGGVLRG